jgi:hypothetical protein
MGRKGADAAIVKYKVMVDKDASAGQNTIHLRHTSSNSGVFVTEGFDVDVTSKEFAQVIYIDKSIISPGNETSLTFTVNNIGNSPLRNLVFSWNDPQGAILPVFSDDTKYIKYLDVGGSVELQYKVAADVNANPGLYLLNLNLKFDIANGTTNQITTKAGIFVGGQTDFDVSYSESSSGQTSLSVANTGNNPAYSVTVRIPDQDGISVSGSSSSIIGNLDKGDYTIVSFQISALNFAASSAQATGQYSQARAAPSGNQTGTFQRNFTMNATPNLKVLVEYTDTVGDRYSVEKSVRLQSSSLTNSSITGFRRQQADYTVPIIIIVAVAAIGGYLFYRRRKKKAKKMQKGSVNPHEAHEGRKTGA